jgi:hypothetical protein
MREKLIDVVYGQMEKEDEFIKLPNYAYPKSLPLKGREICKSCSAYFKQLRRRPHALSLFINPQKIA